MVLAALDLQITSAQDMLRHPEQWEKTGQFAEAEKRNPEAVPAVAWFREEFIPLRPAGRRRLTNPFFEKIFTFNLDRQLKAMFGSSTPGLKWDDVKRKRQTVLLDFRYVRGEHRWFLLLWVFSYLYEWIKTRIWLAIGLQSPHQLDDRLQQTVFSLETYLIGQAATMQGARILADAMFLWEPYLVKHFRPVYGRLSRAEYGVIDEQPQFMPLNEQLEQAALRIRKLGMFQFLVRPAASSD
jgi:hypothetical protein